MFGKHSINHLALYFKSKLRKEKMIKLLICQCYSGWDLSGQMHPPSL